jgi:stage II sporulation protein D
VTQRRYSLRGRVSGAFLLLVAVAWFAETSCRTAPMHRAVVGPGSAAVVSRWVATPSIRVGVAVGVPRTSVAADTGVVIWELGAGAQGADPAYVQRATFVTPEGPKPTPWRVQIASLSDPAAARSLAGRIREALDWEVTVTANPATQMQQVRVGKWRTLDEARAAVEQLARRGFPGGWPATQQEPDDTASVRLLETGRTYHAALIVPASEGERLTIDGNAYRGLVEVRPDGASGVVAINIVNVEDYLRGVVPNELSPLAFPQIEALKAQAVAARTYALRNLGQYAARGFDLCATPACQVYKGLASEHPLTDRAVAETRGVVATYRGELINAMYTSTCGGHTEDAENIFTGPVAPYLRGVACSAERSQWRVIRATAAGAPAAGPGVAPQDAALLLALGTLRPREVAATAAPTAPEVSQWVTHLLGTLSRTGCAAEAAGPLNRREKFFSHLVGRLCWEERARRFLREGDLAYLLQVEDRAEFAGDAERVAAALLIQEEIVVPDGNNRLRPQAAITRGEALAILAQTARRAGAPGLVTAELADVGDGRLDVRQDGPLKTLTIEPTARLVRNVDGATALASELVMIAGEKVRLVEHDGRVSYIESLQSRDGAAADRTSQYYRWEVRLTPSDVARGIAKYGDIGTVRDLAARRHGVSGRVIELAVIGTKGELTLKGLEIRSALALRENLFVIEREMAADGSVRRFVIAGRGWGHGVGLCQVGASGLARAGSTYEEILRHYYTGIAIETR